MHLYRIITNVQAGAEQRTCRPGQPGLATVWVQSDSQEKALQQAREIVESRRYQSVGELTAFQEGSVATGGGAAGESGNEEDPIAAGYLKMREKALSSRDGLFEIWFDEN